METRRVGQCAGAEEGEQGEQAERDGGRGRHGELVCGGLCELVVSYRCWFRREVLAGWELQAVRSAACPPV